MAFALKEEEDDFEGPDPNIPWCRICVCLLLGLIGLPLGADLMVDNPEISRAPLWGDRHGHRSDAGGIGHLVA